MELSQLVAFFLHDCSVMCRWSVHSKWSHQNKRFVCECFEWWKRLTFTLVTVAIFVQTFSNVVRVRVCVVCAVHGHHLLFRVRFGQTKWKKHPHHVLRVRCLACSLSNASNRLCANRMNSVEALNTNDGYRVHGTWCVHVNTNWNYNRHCRVELFRSLFRSNMCVCMGADTLSPRGYSSSHLQRSHSDRMEANALDSVFRPRPLFTPSKQRPAKNITKREVNTAHTIRKFMDFLAVVVALFSHRFCLITWCGIYVRRIRSNDIMINMLVEWMT